MEEMVLLLILAHNVLMALLLMKIKMTELLFEEMVGSIVLKIVTMIMNLMMMAVALLER